MCEIPVRPNCGNYVSLGGGQNDAQFPDCASCVYFSSRNCGKDTGSDTNFFDNQFI